MPTKKDCDGCHGRKAAAITAAEAAIADAEERIRDAERRIGICEDTAEILDPLTRRLHAALHALRQVPHDLGEVYELIYPFIRRGGKMPPPAGGSGKRGMDKADVPPGDRAGASQPPSVPRAFCRPPPSFPTLDRPDRLPASCKAAPVFFLAEASFF